MSMNNPLHGGETYAGTRKLGCCVKALKGAEETSCVALVKPRAVVAHKKSTFAVLFAPAEFDPGARVV